MLQFIRKNKNKLVGWVAVGVCASLMLGFGLGSFFDSPVSAAIAKVNDKEISYGEFSKESQNLSARFRQQFGDNYELIKNQLRLPQLAIDSLTTRLLIDDFTKELGLSVSLMQIENKIRSLPIFGGKFNKETYRLYLKTLGINGSQLEDMVKKDLLEEQLKSILNDLSVLTDDEIRAVYMRNNAKTKFRYIAVESKDFESQVDTNDVKALEDYLEKNSEGYRKPEQFKFSYISFPPEAYLNEVEVTEEDISEYYKEHSTEFFEPRKVHLKQIVIPIRAKTNLMELMNAGSKPDMNEAQMSENPEDVKADAKKRAAAIIERLKKGESFSAVASELTNGDENSGKGSDLGWQELDDLQASIREAALKLTAGTYSDVIETPDGLVIIYLEGEKPRTEKTLEQVRDIIISALRQAEAPTYAEIAADEFHSEWTSADKSKENETTLEAFAKSKNLEVNSPGGFVGSDSTQTSLPAGLMQEVIKLEDKEESMVRIDNTAYFVKVEEIKQSYIPKLEEVKERVVKDFMTHKSLELAEKFAGDLIGELRGLDDKEPQSKDAKEGETESEPAPVVAVKTLGEIASRHNLKLSESEAFSRIEQPKDVFAHGPIHEMAFRLTATKPIHNKPLRKNDAYHIIEFAERLPIAAEDLDKERSTIIANEKAAAMNRLYEGLISTLRADASIWLNPEYSYLLNDEPGQR
ncbi:MAG: SurA N-terminal domain-containing protein [Deltaproteobacteria bacterium]|nr:SurA N-terminal domain-containing protein [Deltaproteobacteria bacterium]